MTLQRFCSLIHTTAVAEAALQRVSASVAVAGGLAASGRAVDLTGLDGAIGNLCAQVLDLPPGDGIGFRKSLEELNDRLAALTAAIRRPQQ